MSQAIAWDLAASGVLTLTLDRPEIRNALDTPGQQLLLRLLQDAERHPGVKVVVLAGRGSAFCTGADVRSMGAPDPDDAIAQEFGATASWQALEARTDRLKHVAQASLRLHAM